MTLTTWQIVSQQALERIVEQDPSTRFAFHFATAHSLLAASAEAGSASARLGFAADAIAHLASGR